MTLILPDPTPRARLLSEQLGDLRRRFAEGRTTLEQVIVALEGRAFTLLMILFALPFIAPVSVPGSSTPLGLLIASVSLQLAFGRLPWLPQRVLKWRLPAGFFGKVIPVTERMVKKLERVLHPRWPGVTATAGRRAVHLLTITFVALMLALPIIVPFTNMFPGWAILLLACGLLERDGIFVVLGYVAFIGNLLYFTVIGTAGTAAFMHVWHRVFGG